MQRRRGPEGEYEEKNEESDWIMQVLALYDYEPEEHDELAFREGDTIRVLRIQSDGWWRGYAVEEPRRWGVFPSNYVQVQHRRQHEEKSNRDSKAQVIFAAPTSAGDDEEDEEDKEEEDESQPRLFPSSTKTSSVLQLKQRLADAERSSRAAREARRKAEREQLRRRQGQIRRTPRRQTKENDEEFEHTEEQDDDAEDDGFATQAQWRQQRRYAEEQAGGGEEDDVEQDEEERGDDVAGDEEQHNPPPVVEDGDEPPLGAFAVPFEQRVMMKGVIDDYNSRHPSNTQLDVAASRIAHRYRAHYHEQKRQQQASTVIAQLIRRHVQRSRASQQQFTATLAIQRWLVLRANSAKVKASRGKRSWRDEAARRIQQWMRQRLAYLRWLAHVEAERSEMVRRREATQLHELKEQEREREEQREQRYREAKQQQQRERQRQAQEQQEMEREQKRQTQEQGREQERKHERERAVPLAETKNKEKRRVMKQEAVMLVKALVTQQLNDKLREHDDQMLELQRMVTRLEDVIRQQSSMIQMTTDEILHLEQQQQQKSRSLKPSPASALVGKDEPTSLPLIIHQRLPPVTLTALTNRPSGIKPPRQFERPATKLPLLSSSAEQ